MQMKGQVLAMPKESATPSESEWQIMEALWASENDLTTLEIQRCIQPRSKMTLRMVRVLTNRLLQKGLVGYTVDEKDSRVYHYHALQTKEECLRIKSQKFVSSYFAGDHASAFAALLKVCTLTEAQIQELEQILEQCGKGGNEEKQ